MSSRGIVDDPGIPGIGFVPTRIVLPMIAENAAATRGETWIIDLLGAGTNTTPSVGPGGTTSPFANMRNVTTVAARDRRIAVFGVALDDIDQGDTGLWLFEGVQGLTSVESVADTNPRDGVFVGSNAATNTISNGVGLMWDGLAAGEGAVLLTGDEALVQEEVKIIGRNMIVQNLVPTGTPVLTGLWFRGIVGFGTEHKAA